MLSTNLLVLFNDSKTEEVDTQLGPLECAMTVTEQIIKGTTECKN